LPLFRYKAVDLNGNPVSGFTFADGDLSLRQKLKSKNRFLVQSSAFTRAASLSLASKRDLFGELRTLLAAGVNLGEALHIMAVEDDRFGDLPALWKQGIEEGRSLSRCVAETPVAADPLVVKMLEVGEATGEMAGCLGQIETHYAGLCKLRDKLISAMIYPIIVLSVSAVAVLVLTFYVIPMFLDMFSRYKVQLPTVTQILLSLTDFLKNQGWLLLLAMVGGLVAFKMLGLANHPRTFQLMHFTPILGKTLTLFGNLNLLRNLANLLRADVRVHDAAHLLKGLFRNPELNRKIEGVGARINKGDALSEALREEGLLASRDLALIRIGEETGQLADQMEHLAKDYEQRLERTLERFLSLFEPVMIVALSGMIGFILVALYLPLFDMLGGGGRR